MAKQPGHNAYLSLDATDISTYTDTESLDRIRNVLEVSAFGDDDRAYIAGLRGHGLAMSGPWDPTGDAVLDGADDGAVVAFVFGPEGNDSGDVQYSGNAFFANYNISSPVDGPVTWSATFTPTGAVTRATV